MASKIKVDQIEGSTGSSITIPTGHSLTVTDGLAASTIGSGTLADARIPNLNASKITAGTLPATRGGTGLSSLGSAGQVVQVNSGGSALEFATASSGTVKQVVHSTGTTTFSSSSSSFVNTPQNIVITPQSASSKIIIQMIMAIWSASGQYMHFKVQASGGATGRIAEWGDTYQTMYGNHPITAYHTGHNTTSAITYTLAVRSDGASYHAPNNNGDSDILNKYMAFAWEVE